MKTVQSMPESIPRTLEARYARLAGLLYLSIIVCGIFAEAGVRSSLIVWGDPDATAARISGAPWLFRLGFLADAIMLLSDVALAILLYTLLKPVNRTLSMSAAAFRLTQAAVIGMNLLIYYAAMLLLNGNAHGSVFTAEQIHSLALLFLEIHSHGYDVGLLFFGVSSLLVGMLVVRSRYMPAMLGYALVTSGMVYLAGSTARFLFPTLHSIMQPAYLIPLIAELAFCLWLLLRGHTLRPVPDETGPAG